MADTQRDILQREWLKISSSDHAAVQTYVARLIDLVGELEFSRAIADQRAKKLKEQVDRQTKMIDNLNNTLWPAKRN